MVNSTIILYGIFAGLVAILVTVAIERFGGVIGGVLGTIPSTIVPAAAGVYLIDGKESLISSMLNSSYWDANKWIISWRMDGVSRFIKDERLRLPSTIAASLSAWAVLALTSLMIVRHITNGIISELALGLVGLFALACLAIFFNIQSIAAPKGINKVPLVILSIRGIAAGLAIAFCLFLAELELPFLAGLASAFPAIFLTSMVALWLSQGPQVPRGAAAPMMLGGASVSVYALIVMWSLPSFGIIYGSVIAWFGAVGLWTLPSCLVLKRYRSSID